MPTAQLHEIAFLFPNTTAAVSAFFDTITKLLAPASGATQTADQLTLTPTNPADALPITTLQRQPVAFPSIRFATDQLIDLHVGALHLYSSPVTIQQTESAVLEQVPDPNLLTAEDFAQRLAGHITRVDHTGVNLPIGQLDQAGWDALVQQLAGVSNLYAYPTGEPWPFVIPATNAEFAGAMAEFVAGREPKFELVYDQWTPEPLLQFALGTDLTRTQLEELLPEPVGWVIPELAEIFRSVFLAHPWPGLRIRFDLYYRSDTVSDWDTGEWLVTAGGRIQ